jgi:F-type H+-transporting ATPase subunit b
MAQMEAKIYEMQQKVQFTQEIKSTLDAWVRHETNIRDQEQKRLVSQIIEKVKSQLNDPKVQARILAQSVADVESNLIFLTLEIIKA